MKNLAYILVTILAFGLGESFASQSNAKDTEEFSIYATQGIKVTLVPDGMPKATLEGLIKFDLRLSNVRRPAEAIADKPSISLTVRDLSLIVYGFPYASIASKTAYLPRKRGIAGISFPSNQTILLKQESDQKLTGEIPVQMPLPSREPRIKDVHGNDGLPPTNRIQTGLLSLTIEFDEPAESLISKGKVLRGATLSGSLRVQSITYDIDTYRGYVVELPRTRIQVYSANLSSYVAVQKLCLQPVSIRNSKRDRNPTGKSGQSFSMGLTHSETVWGKLGTGNNTIRLTQKPLKKISKPQLKSIIGGTGLFSFPTEITRECISVFSVQKLTGGYGGGAAPNGGTESAYVVLSDEIATTDEGKHVLAHELGHVLKLNHPNAPASWFIPSSPGTIMCAADQSENRSKNSMENIGHASNPYLFPDSEPMVVPAADCSGETCNRCSN